MKRYIFAAVAVMMVLSLFVVGVGASESNTAAVESVVSESAAESEIEASEEVDETVAETSPTVDEIDSQAVADHIVAAE